MEAGIFGNLVKCQLPLSLLSRNPGIAGLPRGGGAQVRTPGEQQEKKRIFCGSHNPNKGCRPGLTI